MEWGPTEASSPFWCLGHPQKWIVILLCTSTFSCRLSRISKHSTCTVFLFPLRNCQFNLMITYYDLQSSLLHGEWQDCYVKSVHLHYHTDKGIRDNNEICSGRELFKSITINNDKALNRG